MSAQLACLPCFTRARTRTQGRPAGRTPYCPSWLGSTGLAVAARRVSAGDCRPQSTPAAFSAVVRRRTTTHPALGPLEPSLPRQRPTALGL